MISIILPIYNEEKTIERMLKTIVNQTYSNYEVILINDGSKDKTHEICERYTALDSKFKYFYQKNSGVAKARNFGLQESKGNYIGFLDADDYIEPDYLEKLIKGYTDSHPVDLVVCSYVQNGEVRQFNNKIINKEQALRELLEIKGSKGYLWNKLFHRQTILRNSLTFDGNIKVASDLPFCVEYIIQINNIKYISDVLIHYSVNSSSISNDITNPKILTQLDAIDKCINLLKKGSYSEEIVNKYITAYIRTATGILFRRKFSFTKRTYYKLSDALNIYDINKIQGIFVKLKYIVGKFLLHIQGIKIKV